MSTGPGMVVVTPGVVIEAYSLVPPTVVEIAVQGPQGPKGDPDSGQLLIVNQATPVTTKTISHTFNRLVHVQIYINNRIIQCQTEVTNDTVVVTFPSGSPQAFTAVLR